MILTIENKSNIYPSYENPSSQIEIPDWIAEKAGIHAAGRVLILDELERSFKFWSPSLEKEFFVGKQHVKFLVREEHKLEKWGFEL